VAEIPKELTRAVIDACRRKLRHLDESLFARDAAGCFRALAPGERLATRELLSDALVLTLWPRPRRRRKDRDLARAMVLRTVREGQIRDRQLPVRGVFRKYIGPGAQAEPIDHNWAAFCGCALATLWQGDPEALRDWPDQDRRTLEKALLLAAEAMLARWPRKGYTNILLMALYLTLAAGRLLRDQDLRRQAEQKFAEALRFVRTTESFEEYLSPTYAGVNFSALVPMAALERGGALESNCLWLLELQWRLLGRQAHLPTGQIAGPHSRAYSDMVGRAPSATYDYLFLATAGRYALDPEKFTILGLPGLIWPLHVPDDALAEMLDEYRTGPRQHRQIVEWIGRDPDLDAPAPGEGARRLRLTTTYKTSQFCVGSVNEQDVWHQRRNLLVYWPDGAGGTTGLKAEVEIVPQRSEARFLPEWPFQMAITFSSVQDGPAVLAAYHTAAILPAKKGDTLQALSRYVAAGHESDTEPREPIAWLLGSHWRQPIEPPQRFARLENLTIRLCRLGPGNWRQQDRLGLVWTFSQGSTCCAVRLAHSASLDEHGLVLADFRNLEWDWLAPPDLFVPLALAIGPAEAAARAKAQPVEVDRQAGGAFSLAWSWPAGRSLLLRHRPTPAPDQVDRPTWTGLIDGEAIAAAPR